MCIVQGGDRKDVFLYQADDTTCVAYGFGASGD